VPWVLITVGGAALLLTAFWTTPRWLVPHLAARSPRCLYAARTRDRVLALTFDDGPDAAHTAQILDVLAKHDARATFFLVSSHVRGNEALVSRIVARGHEIGNHLTHVESSLRLSPQAFDAAVREAGAVLGAFAHVTWCRPASGWYNATMLATIEAAGYRCALGSVYPYDAHIPSPAFASAYILSNSRAGAIVVLHEGSTRGARTVRTLDRVLPVLKARGFRFVSLSDLVTRT
jgi:peptidoglycan-N-acetylglucosamine deacetylase